jgi:rhamnopyranosyl-N-acetylglucosaminyl-diphospho-decaprenol beta-1,3/1,4-galactofuranosyltransferase
VRQRIGALIVTYNNVSMLRSLLKDLLRQTRRPDEIIIIDNASSDDTARMISEYPRLRYIRLHKNEGSAGGYYAGLKTASKHNDFVWTLDDDLILGRNSLELLERWWSILEKDYPLGAVRCITSDAYRLIKPIRINTFAWRGTLLKKDVILDVGLPLKKYFLYAEDDEYGHRIIKRGYVMFYIPKSLMAERRIRDKLILDIWGRRKFYYKDGFRFYYAFRNQIDLYLRYKETFNFVKTIYYAFFVIFIYIFFKPFKSIEIINAIIDGVWDGLHSRLGKNGKYMPSC